MEFKKAERSACKIKLSIAGPSGSGKTYSALQLANGLVDDWSKVGVIDTENGSASLYSHLGDYQTLTMKAPFSPERYVEAIEAAEKAGFQCLIIDSLTHAWESILQTHANMSGNSFLAWQRLTPLHNSLIQAILQCNMHVIVTIRSKQDYAINTVNGKAVPEKLGLKPIARDGIEYEFSVAFEINHHHAATVSKDRTGLFKDQVGFIIGPETGKAIRDWCETGSEDQVTEEQQADSIWDHILNTADKIHDPFARKILDAESMEELQRIYDTTPEIQEEVMYRRLCTRRKQELLNQKHKLNGQHA